MVSTKYLLSFLTISSIVLAISCVPIDSVISDGVELNMNNEEAHSMNDDQIYSSNERLFAGRIPTNKREYPTEGILLGRREYPTEGILLGKREYPTEGILLGKREYPTEGILLGKREYPTEGILLGKREYPTEGILLGKREYPTEGILLGKRNMRYFAPKSFGMAKNHFNN